MKSQKRILAIVLCIALAFVQISFADTVLQNVNAEELGAPEPPGEGEEESEPSWKNIDIEYKYDGVGNIAWYPVEFSKNELEISTAEDLIGLSDLVNGKVTKVTKVYVTKNGETTLESEEEEVLRADFKGITVNLTADLDLKAKEWTPIGLDEEHKFLGKFDGKGHTIKNLNLIGIENAGFILNAENMQLNNLALVNFSFEGTESAAAFVYNGKDVKISNVFASGTVKAPQNKAFCIKLEGNSSIKSAIYYGSDETAPELGECPNISKTYMLGSESNDKVKTKEEFKKEAKKLAYELDTEEDDAGKIKEKSKVWTFVEDYPILTADESKSVYKISIKEAENATIKVNEKYVIVGDKTEVLAETKTDEYVIKSINIDSIEKEITKLFVKPYFFDMPSDNVKISADVVKKTDIGDYKDNCSVTFILNGGEVAGNTGGDEYRISKKAGESIVAPKVTKKDHILVGWFLDDKLTKKIDLDNIKEPEILYKDVTLYAKWARESEVLVSFDFNDNNQSGNAPIEAKFVDRGAKIEEPTKPIWIIKKQGSIILEENKFLGWFTEKEEDKGKKWDFEKDVIEPKKGVDSLVLYAHWKKETIADVFKTGTKEKPYIIKDLDVLSIFRDSVNSGESYENCYFSLGEDIELKNKDTQESLAWVPIGTEDNPFSGNFDGNGKKIQCLKIANGPNVEIDYAGVFGYIKNADILNLTVRIDEGGIKDFEGKALAAVCGYAVGNSIISNCKAENGNISANASCVAGILGAIGGVKNNSNIKIEKCQNLVNIKNIKDDSGIDDSFTAGITCGFSQRGWGTSPVRLTIIECANYGKIELDKGTGGGILASFDKNKETVLKKCKNEGEIKAGDTKACGGIAGDLGTVCEVSECENFATINSAGGKVGGILGTADICAKITNCTNHKGATIGDRSFTIANPKNYTGGIAGYLDSNIFEFSNCKNMADIYCEGLNVGGLVGRFEGAFQTGNDMVGLSNEGNIYCKVESANTNEGVGGLFGYLGCAYQRIHEAYNTGDIKANGGAIGGICGILNKYTQLKNVYNAGEITLDTENISGDVSANKHIIGGIVGSKRNDVSGYIICGYSLSELDKNQEAYGGAEKVGVISGNGKDTNLNCYYLSKDGEDVETTDRHENGRSKNQFVNGTVAYELDNKNKYTRTYDWIQAERFPAFKKDGVTIYRYVVNDTEHGKLTPVSGFKNSGEEILFNIQADSGYMLESVKVLGKDGKEYRAVIDVSQNILKFVMPQVDVTIEGKFIKNTSGKRVGVDECIVSYHMGSKMETKTVKYGGTAEKIEHIKKDGFVFEGWYADSNFANKYDFNKAVTKNIDLYAKYTKESDLECSIEFNINGANSPKPETQKKKPGELVEKPDTPTKTGSNGEIYYFEGWYTEINAGKKWDFEKDKVSESMVLFARFTEGDRYVNGTASNPYTFYDEDDLKAFGERVNLGFGYFGKYFALGKDLNIDSTNWKGIGYVSVKGKHDVSEITESGTVPFQGNFDGHGKTITLNSDIMHGLFGSVGTGAVIENVKVKSQLGESNARKIFGGVADINFGKINNCETELVSDENTGNVAVCAGGIAGINPGTISNSKALVKFRQNGTTWLRGAYGLGGITGYLRFGVIEGCTVKKGSSIVVPENGEVSHVGGIAGTTTSDVTEILSDRSGIVRNCIVEQGVEIKNLSTGGMDYQITTGGLTGYGAIVENCFCGAGIEVQKGQCGLLVGYPQDVGGGSGISNCVWYGPRASVRNHDKRISLPVGSVYKNCYLGVMGSNFDKLEDLFDTFKDQDDNYISGIDKEIAKNIYVKADKFTSGEVAWLLDGGTGVHRNAWTQDKDEHLPYPGKPSVYKVSIKVNDPTNAGNTVKISNKKYVNGANEVMYMTADKFSLGIEKNPGYSRKLSNGDKKEVKYSLKLLVNGTDIADRYSSFKLDENADIAATFSKIENIEEKRVEKDKGRKSKGDGNGDGDGNSNNNGIGDGKEGDGKVEGSGTSPTGKEDGSDLVQNVPKVEGDLEKNSAKDIGLQVADESQIDVAELKEADVDENVATEMPKIGSAESASIENENAQNKDEEKLSIFEIVKKQVQENPLIAAAGAVMVTVFAVGGMLSKAGVFAGVAKTQAGNLAGIKSMLDTKFRVRRKK